MSIARLVASMKAAGCTAEQIGEAALAYSGGGERSSAAARQARYRAKKKGDIAPTDVVTRDVTRDVTVTRNGDAKRYVSEPPLACAFSTGEEVSILPPEKPTVSTPKGDERKSSNSRGSRLSEDWRPDDDGRRLAVELLGSNAAAHAELAKFRDFWRAKAGASARKADWDATWRNWVRNGADARPRGPPGFGNGLDRKPTIFDAARARLEKRFNSPDNDLPAGESGGVRNNPLRLLSSN